VKQRTIDLLEYCSIPLDYFNPKGSKRQAELDRLCLIYSKKAVYYKLSDLADKGYIEYGTSVRSAWLTDKGKETLRNQVN
jgi:Mn-dependent DtxR family transcriptional regulator